MKSAILAVALLLSFSSFARAEEAPDPWKWTTQDSVLQAVTVGLLVADYGQTRTLAKESGRIAHVTNEVLPDGTRVARGYVNYERNPILGKSPKMGTVNVYFLSSIVLHSAVSAVLPREATVAGFKVYPRTIWQSVWIGTEVYAVGTNVKAGVRISF